MIPGHSRKSVHMTDTKTMLQNHVDAIAHDLALPRSSDWFADFIANENREPTATDYIEDILDYEITHGSQGDAVGVNLLISYGGPNIWILTDFRIVFGAWAGTIAMAHYNDHMNIKDAALEAYANT